MGAAETVVVSIWSGWPVAVALLVVFAVAWWAHIRFWVRRLTPELSYAETLRLPTADDSAIELRRIPRSAPLAETVPVLIVHGLAANHRNEDLCADLSLARHLAAAGRDVWLVTLRSGRADLGWRERGRASFTAMVHHDLPLAVQTVLTRTGTAALDYIGFSMGGMLAYAAFGRTVPRASVRRAVIVGSPGRVGVPLPVVGHLRGIPDWLAPPLLFRVGARTLACCVEGFRTPLHRIPINPDNVPAGLMGAAMVAMIEDVPRALHREFWRWAMADGEIRVDGARALDGLADLDIPVLFFAGAADYLAGPHSVGIARDAWCQRVSRELIVLSRETGFSADYGHGDLAIGREAPREVFIPIAAFLAGTPSAPGAQAQPGEQT